METLVWIGTALTALGIAILVWCAVVAVRARREGLTGPAMEARLRKLVAANLGALALSTIGLITVFMGVILA